MSSAAINIIIVIQTLKNKREIEYTTIWVRPTDTLEKGPVKAVDILLEIAIRFASSPRSLCA